LNEYPDQIDGFEPLGQVYEAQCDVYINWNMKEWLMTMVLVPV